MINLKILVFAIRDKWLLKCHVKERYINTGVIKKKCLLAFKEKIGKIQV